MRSRIGLICLTILMVFVVAVGPVSAQTANVQMYQSRNFRMYTDLAAADARDLLSRLETMLGLISAYWGQPNKQVIEMYVAEDITRWPAQVLAQMDPDGIQQIRSGAGVTASVSRISAISRQTKSKVYAVADHGTPQHEAVHAYCHQTFGTSGPLWYSEGMAEMGQYWKKDDASVNCSEIVLRYLKQSEPKSLNEIVNPQTEFTGDSWQNYAWRWALCHLLANNTNYAARFRPLGLGLLMKKNVSFEQVYGSMSDEIVFEYLEMLKSMETGYRADLCSWDWTAKFVSPTRSRTLRSEIEAGRGWQATKARLTKDTEYNYSAGGFWKTSKEGVPVSAAGDEDNRGRLIGVLFDDYKLSEPFELDTYGTFTAEADGQLFVRCQDEWGQLADNSGEIDFLIKENDSTRPLPRPDQRTSQTMLADADESETKSSTSTPKNTETDDALRKAKSKLRFGKLLMQNNAAKARRYLEEAIELAPSSDTAKAAKNLLNEL
ncbi:tetratricopeptide repeat protein [Thalassoroseus pseudoceratinae]|uniref:tetratricopeptide repeat protein n=1 Tax=Thalassoroseus pseudoceratinae TaxID=2713176 RepID=UPI00197CD9CD|nr:hypothetical protein [Thalassoroseus pseudoceratinae]